MGLVWLVLGTGGPAEAENRGGTEAEVRQGSLSRWSAWWTPGPGTEGRFWWEPEAGGAAWLRVGEFQFGPLQEVPGAEGTVVWGPATRQSGVWGAAWSGPAAGAWALQKPDRLDAGFRAFWGNGPATLGATVSRSWALGPGGPVFGGPDPRWSDQVLAGGTWSGTGWKAGVELRASTDDQGAVAPAAAGRLSAGDGPWDLEGKAQTSGPESWSARGRLRWEDAGCRVEGAWDRTEGTSVLAAAEGKAGTLTGGTEASVRYREGLWSGSAGVSVSAKAERGRWKLGWTLTPEPARTVQKTEASWKEPGLEASADWTVEGLRLGWFGPGSRLTWKLRWEF